MFDLNSFSYNAHMGYEIDMEGFVDYLNSFNKIIIWGAGNLGKAVGKKLIEMGVNLTIYWDAKWDTIHECNGLKVYSYGTTEDECDKNEVMVLFCIANVPVSPKLLRRLKSDGWNNVINGLTILEGIICPFKNGEDFDTSICTSMEMCTVCNCQRLHNMMQNKICKEKGIKKENVLSFDRIHFIVNNFCNLQCTHCFMYMNSYPNERKHNVDRSIICRDIDMIFGAIDSFGVVNVFGGEPFLHPEIDKIVDKILEHSNAFGSMIVNTNGIIKMRDSQLRPMIDHRIRLAFSNYTQALSKDKIEIFKNHVEYAKSKGITVGVQNELPTWNVSSTLKDNLCSKDDMIRYKKECGVKFLYVFDGKVFPCSFCLSLYDLGVADYKSDYVDISKCSSPEELREKIIEMMNNPYNMSCGHCDKGLSTRSIAGEQGFDGRYALP